MLRTIVLACAALAVASQAFGAYTTDFSTDKSADFSLMQVGQDGDQNGTGTHCITDFTGGRLRLAGRYGHYGSVALKVSGDANNGVYSDTEASINFTLYNGASFAANSGLTLEMAVRETAQSNFVNTYPLYRVFWNTATQTLNLGETVGYGSTRVRTIATSSPITNLLGGTNSYKLFVSAKTDAVTGDVNLIGQLLENGNLVANISGIDYAKAATQEGGGSADWADSGVDTPPSGVVGFCAGVGGGTIQGIDVTGFSVAVPEPATMSLLGLGLFGLLRRRS